MPQDDFLAAAVQYVRFGTPFTAPVTREHTDELLQLGKRLIRFAIDLDQYGKPFAPVEIHPILGNRVITPPVPSELHRQLPHQAELPFMVDMAAD